MEYGDNASVDERFGCSVKEETVCEDPAPSPDHWLAPPLFVAPSSAGLSVLRETVYQPEDIQNNSKSQLNFCQGDGVRRRNGAAIWIRPRYCS